MPLASRPPPPSSSSFAATSAVTKTHHIAEMTTSSMPRLPNAPAPAPAPVPAASSTARAKKAKNKKVADPLEAQRLLEAKISQLELDATGEQNEEQEIKREARKAAKDFNDGLSHMSVIDKVEALRKKNSELMADMKRLERTLLKSKKREDQLRKEKDSTRTEQSKTATAKDIAEKVARELRQERNKAQEELRRANDEALRRREKMDAKDAALIGDVEEFIQAKSRLSAPAQEKPEIETLFRQRFKSLFEQLATSELRFQHAIRSKDAELHLVQGRLDHQRRLYDAEMGRSRSLNAQVQTFSQTETELRSQLNIYVEKFKQVEDTLNNSNELFLTFRKEMEEMSKKTKRLEKENLNLTRKHDLNNRNILEMAEDRTKTTTENERLKRTVATLQSTIRQMQSQGRKLPVGSALNPEDETESEYGSEEGADYELASDDVYVDDEDEDDDDKEGNVGDQLQIADALSQAASANSVNKTVVSRHANLPSLGPPRPPPAPAPPSSSAPKAAKAPPLSTSTSSASSTSTTTVAPAAASKPVKMVNGHRKGSALVHS